MGHVSHMLQILFAAPHGSLPGGAASMPEADACLHGQESNLVRLAQQQASREEELTHARRQTAELENEVADLTATLNLHEKQADVLKEVCAPHSASGCL